MTFPFVVVPPRVRVVTYVGKPAAQTASNSAFTFTGASIGGPGLIVVCAMAKSHSGASYNASSITLGGVSMTAASNASNDEPTAIFYLRVSSGTSADIVVTWSGYMDGCEISVYRISGVNSDTPVGNAASYGSFVANRSISLTTGTGAIIVVGSNSSATTSFTTDVVTEDMDTQVGAIFTAYSGHLNGFAGTSPVTITATPAASSNLSIAGASWF